jgi:uncharacterized SAM-binding protein YcdF (DUF218 family)
LPASHRFGRAFLLVLFTAVLLFLFSYKIALRAAGEYLVTSSPLEKADAAVVLAGDYDGFRILRAGELVRDGYTPVALVSGPKTVYGLSEAALAIQYAVGQGVPASYFEPFSLEALSTLEEARAFAPELRKRNIHKILLVTSNYHTHRATSIFRRVLGNGIEVRAVPAPDKYFKPESWWQAREGQKILFYEYSKTIADWLGM